MGHGKCTTPAEVQKIIDRFAAPPPPPAPITTGADGTITIPAASLSSKNASAPVSIMTSADEGSQRFEMAEDGRFSNPAVYFLLIFR